MFALLSLQVMAQAMLPMSTIHETPWQIIPIETRVDSFGETHTRRRRRNPVTIHRTLLPENRAMETAHAPFVACRVSFSQHADGWNTDVAGCVEAFRDATAAAVRRWEVSAPTGLRNASFSVTIVYTNEQHDQAVHVAVESQHIRSDTAPWFVARDYPHRPDRWMLHYPQQATALRLPEQVCSVETIIDTRGRPSDVQVWGCHAALRDSLAEDVTGWRYAPYMVDGQATLVPKRMLVRFKPKR